MSSKPPYAADAARFRLLYRLPLSSTVRRILVIGSDSDADAAFDRASHEIEIEVVEPFASIADSTFDVVALPDCLPAGCANRQVRAASKPSEGLLPTAYAALRPGGVVVGHLDHLASTYGLKQLLGGKYRGGTWSGALSLMTGSACRRTLTNAGFVEPECFYVEPRISAPMVLVPIHARAARRHFLRAIRRTRSHHTMPGHLLRMALAGLGYGGLLQPNLFFWARRPC